jgi:glycosyltransferase involved in cell wall biosynthesis
MKVETRVSKKEAKKISNRKGKKMKILMLNYEFPPLGGGAANATYYLLKEFSKVKNLEIDLVTSSTDEFKVEQFAPNIKIHFLDIGKNGELHYQSNKDLLKYSYNAYKYSKNLMKEKNFDLCHAFFGIPCGYIAMKLKLPYIVSLRGSDVPFYNKRFEKLDKLIFKRLSKKIWKNSKATITNSDGLKELAIESSPNQEIGVIYNGVDTEEFKPLKTRKKNKKIILISTGRLIKRKGYQYLIPALKGMKNVELQLIGDGNLTDELKTLATKNKVDVKFLGKMKHSDLIKALQKADIFVLPSKNEGMSNSILEAMACGLPIITTDTGGSKELIKENGFIIEKESASSIKNVLDKYADNKTLIKKQGKKSGEITKKMSWTNMAKSYLEAYRE